MELPAKFRTLALGSVDVADVFYDFKPGRTISVSATGGNFSPPYPVPVSGVVSLYRMVPPVPPETKPRRLSLGEVTLGKGGPWLVLMKAPGAVDAPLQLQAIDDSWASHPVHTMRIFNFSKRRAAVNMGESTFELSTGGSRIISYPSSATSQVWMKVALMEESGWELRVAGPKAMIPKTRSTFILADGPIEPGRSDFIGVNTSTLIDREPKPAKPASVLASQP